jgi:transposase
MSCTGCSPPRACDVVAPSLIPKGSGDRVKTDRRDSRRLAGLHRAGELTAVAVPTRGQEAVQDLCRTRGDMVEDLTLARNRLSGFLLRHSMVYRGVTRIGGLRLAAEVFDWRRFPRARPFMRSAVRPATARGAGSTSIRPARPSSGVAGNR